MRLGIVGRLVLLLMVVGVVVAGMTGYYAYQSSRALLVASAKNKLLTSTQVLARRITVSREEISRNLEVLARFPASAAVLQYGDVPQTDPSAPAALAVQEEQLATLFKLLMSANPSYQQLRLISARDYGLERVRVDRVGPALVRVQGDDLQEKGHFAYVFEALKLPAGATYMSRISINHESGNLAGLDQPGLQLAQPILGGYGQVVGVVVVNLDLKGFFALLGADLPQAFQLFLANSEGDILVHPDSSKTFGFDKGRRVLVQDEFEPLRGLVFGQQDQVVFEARDGSYAAAPVVAAFTSQHIKMVSSDSRLILGLAQPLEQVLAQSQELGTAIVQIVAGLILVCLLLAVLMARAWTRPINAINRAAQRIANGQPPGELPLQRRDEIGSLARSFQAMHSQITQQLAALQDNQDALEHLAQHDMLTSLPNRRLFQERLDHALAHARRYGGHVCLLFIDLDAFKPINDSLGHDVGDVVLQTVAQRMQQMMREVDTVARLGGDEFVVLLGAPVPHAHLSVVAEKLLAGLREPIQVQAHSLHVTASIGISRYPQDGSSAAEMLATADQAMYAAKLAGRDGFRFFSDPAT